MSGEKRLVLSALAGLIGDETNKTVAFPDLRRLEWLTVVLSEEEIRDALDSLHDSGLLVREAETDSYGFAIPLVEMWVRQNQNPAKTLAEELKRSRPTGPIRSRPSTA